VSEPTAAEVIRGDEERLVAGPSRYRHAVVRWPGGVLVTVVLTWFALLLITGHYIDEGPVLLQVTRQHGLHEGDIFVMLGWLVAMVASVVLVATSGAPRRRESRRPRG